MVKGLVDELHDRGYLVIDGVDGKAHYVALNARDELPNYPTGTVVEVRGSAEVRAADKNIAALASDGLYRTDHHLAIEQGRAKLGRDPQEVVAAHVRRLEALRRAGIVERVADGLWKAPEDLAEPGRQYDAQRLGGVAVELRSYLPIERQARVIGATWLDQQLIGGGKGLGDLGFGGDAKQGQASMPPGALWRLINPAHACSRTGAAMLPDAAARLGSACSRPRPNQST